MNEWQPIETAPKDGTFVLLYEPGHEAIEYDDGFIDCACWSGHFWESGGGAGVEPTHWMPLPEPPK